MRFLRFTDKEEVMSVARKELKDKVFSMYDDISKDLYDLRKQQQKKFKQARDKGYRVHFSKAHPDQLFVNGKFLPPDQPLVKLFFLLLRTLMVCLLIKDFNFYCICHPAKLCKS